MRGCKQHFIFVRSALLPLPELNCNGFNFITGLGYTKSNKHELHLFSAFKIKKLVAWYREPSVWLKLIR